MNVLRYPPEPVPPAGRTGSGFPRSPETAGGPFARVLADLDELPGGELRARRCRLGLTQAALADELGVRSNTVARWERGEKRIAKPRLVRAALERLEVQRRAS